MKLIKISPEQRPHIGTRREICFDTTPLKCAASIQISELRKDREEEYHINRKGYVLCVVVTGWMSAHCNGNNHEISEGQGIIFEPGERHRINSGEGWMLSISSLDYDDLDTVWEIN